MGDERVGTAPVVETGAAGGTRSQHVVVMGAMEPRTVQAALRPGVERSRQGGAPSGPACLVITPTGVATQLAATEARDLLDAPTLRVVPVTAAARAKRVLATSPVAIAIGTPADLLALRRGSALSMDSLQAVVLLGIDAMLAEQGTRDAIEALLTDLPSNAVRVVSSASEDDAEVKEFLERYLPKARHITPLVKATSVSFNVTPHYLITAPAARTVALRTFLDERDPPSLAIIAGNDVAEAEAAEALAQLGLRVDGRATQIVRVSPLGHTAAVIGWDMPATAEALSSALAGQPVEAVFFIQPSDVPAMTAVSGGAARPLTLETAKAETKRGADAIHVAMRNALTDMRTVGAADLALVAPLLDEFDPVEVAAAALRLFDDARRALSIAHGSAQANRAVFASPVRAAAAAASESAANSGTTRVFFNVGKRDNVRPGDLLGAIAGESGLPGDRIGSIDLFESHTLVEIASESVETVIAKLTGVTLRGRQLHVRRDDRGAGGHAGFAGSRGGAERGGDRGGDRPRGGPGRERGGDRGASRGGKPWEERGESRGPRSGAGGAGGAGRGAGGGEGRGAGGGEGRGAGGAGRGFGGDEGRSGPPRPRPEFGGGERGPARGGSDRGPSRGPSRGPDRGGDRGPRGAGPRGDGPRAFGADAARREFGDRSASERTEARGEWASRGEQLSRSSRPRPDARGADRGNGRGNDRGPRSGGGSSLPFRRRPSGD